MQTSREQRRSPREPSKSRVWVRWSDRSGIPLGGRFCAVDVSASGLCVLLERRLDPFTYVHIESKDLKLTGMAIVRHCSPKGMNWLAGLQMNGRSITND